MLALCCRIAIAQEADTKHDEEIDLVLENDFFFFEDYYYTAGQDAVYRRLARPSSRVHRFFGKSDTAKVILAYKAGFKIFNPYDIDAVKTGGMDRPYAGWTYVSAGVSNFRKASSGNYFGAELGIVGPASGMEKLQLWWHKVTNYDPPMGWSQQIRNELVFNAGYSRYQQFILAEDADIVTQSSVQLGTGSNKISQDITLRLVSFNSINNSVFTQSRLSAGPTDGEKTEVFIFVGGGLDYVLSNIFLEGSVFKGHPSVYEVPALPWVARRNIGIMGSTRKVSWGATFTHLTKEVSSGHHHDYLSLRLAFRF